MHHREGQNGDRTCNSARRLRMNPSAPYQFAGTADWFPLARIDGPMRRHFIVAVTRPSCEEPTFTACPILSFHCISAMRATSNPSQRDWSARDISGA
mmetsp:Transcript_79074/g.212216  ORF Transcript_79074/g.212216 Transcript_79074/m.212216 type:complete len:97 (+) Transcript_79074:283-573(+)